MSVAAAREKIQDETCCWGVSDELLDRLILEVQVAGNCHRDCTGLDGADCSRCIAEAKLAELKVSTGGVDVE